MGFAPGSRHGPVPHPRPFPGIRQYHHVTVLSMTHFACRSSCDVTPAASSFNGSLVQVEAMTAVNQERLTGRELGFR
jgi:hypothetical protein